MRVTTCSCPAAVSILCRACRVDEEDMDTDVLCLSQLTSSHIQDSCRGTDRVNDIVNNPHRDLLTLAIYTEHTVHRLFHATVITFCASVAVSGFIAWGRKWAWFDRQHFGNPSEMSLK